MEQFDPCSAGMLHFFPTVSTVPFALIFCKDMVLFRVVQGVLNHP